MQVRGVAQSRARAEGLGDGQYESRLTALPAAQYELMVQAPAVDLGYERGRLGRMLWPLARERAVDNTVLAPSERSP
jgi:hypothetical protein